MTEWGVDASVLAANLVPVLTVYREAANQGVDGMAGVSWVILNRMHRRQQTAAEVCLAKWQFSSMDAPGDPGMTHYPITEADQDAFQKAFQVWTGCLDGTIGDPTHGSDLYYATSIAPPSWVVRATFTTQIGTQRFYKDS